MSAQGDKGLRRIFLIVGAVGVGVGLLSLPTEGTLIGLGLMTFGILACLLLTGHLSYVFIGWFIIVPFFNHDQVDVVTAIDIGTGNLSLDRLLFGLIFLLLFANICLKKIRIVRIDSIETIIIIFSLVVFSSLVIHGKIARYSIGVWTAMFLLPMLTYFIGKNVFTTERTIKIFLWALFLFGAYLGVIAFLEFFKLNSFVFPRYITNLTVGTREHVGRARGPFLQAATNGTAMGMILFAGIYLYGSVASWGKRLFIVASSGMLLSGVFFSLTRGAWLGTIVGLLLVSISHRHLRRVVPLALVIGALSLPLMMAGRSTTETEVAERTTDAGTAYFRYNTWMSGVRMFLENPLFGVGFTRYSELNHRYQRNMWLYSATQVRVGQGAAAHNIFITIAAELGLAGLVPYLAILLWMVTISIKLYRAPPPAVARARSFILMYWGAAVVFFISSLFYTQNSLFLSSLFFTFSGIIGRWYALENIIQRHEGGRTRLDLPYTWHSRSPRQFSFTTSYRRI